MSDHSDNAKKLVSQMTLNEKISQLLNASPAIERLGIPEYNWWNEALHGVARAGVATVFPQAIGLAATFDDELLHDVAEVIFDEARAKYNEFDSAGDHGIYKGLTYWSPNINIFRDPRWGRGHETYGEDPFLTAKMATAFIRGLQGEDENHHKLDATLKHFAVHSGPEGIRHGFDAKVSQKDLYETYLWAFRYCIKNARPAAVMAAYNAINGEPCCGSGYLLKTVLREELGFRGYVVSDCGAICDLYDHHHAASSRAEAAAMALNSGCELNCGQAYENLVIAFETGLTNEAAITAAAEKLFEARYRLGMFAPPKERPCACLDYDIVACPEHLAISRKAAASSMVLLKNSGVLPIANNIGSIAVIGPNADVRDVLLGNYNGTPSDYLTFLQAAKQNLGNRRIYYSRGCDIVRDDIPFFVENPFTEAIIVSKKSDLILFCCGLQPAFEGEEGDAFNSDAGGDKRSLALPMSQQKLLTELLGLGKPVVLINFSGSAISFEPYTGRVAAILQVWYPGEQGANAICDILAGKCNPSAKLPVTFYRSDFELPPFEDYSMRGRTYRHMDKEALFDFGFGLSYSRFTFYEARVAGVDRLNKNLTVSVRLCNSSDTGGDEVVQIYAKRESRFESRNPRLVAFKKVAVPAGETVEASIMVEFDPMYVFDDAGNQLCEDGDYTLYIGGHQPNAHSDRLADSQCLELPFKLIHQFPADFDR